MQTTIPSPNQPLGAGRDQRRRILLHHVPLAFASAVVLFLFMSLPIFGATVYPHADIVSGTFPQKRGEGGSMDHGGDDTGSMGHHGVTAEEILRHLRQRGGDHTGLMDHGEDHTEPMGDGGGHSSSLTLSPDEIQSRIQRRSFIRQFTVATGYVATGYVALGLLVLTLLLGPANLLLRRRLPVSNYLSRDVGTWAAIFSVVHVIVAALAHVDDDAGLIASFLHFFVAHDGSLLTNSFGLGNWTGLAALVIVVGLLAISNDFALRKLKAKLWKQLQRLNYALFALVILHAFFYGALLRVISPFTLLLGLSVVAVFVGQAVGIWLWRRKYSRTVVKLA